MSNLGKVQKKKKSTKLSAFWIYAWELKKKMNQQGHNIQNDRQLQEMAGKSWAKLSEEKQEEYKVKAKNSTAIPNTTRVKYNSFGQSLAEIEAKEVKAREDVQNKVKDIEELLDQANSMGELDSLVFYFISTTSFYVCDRGIYPAELAMAKFSLKEGIFDEVQVRINPGSLPVGSRLTAQENSRTKHKYPLPPDCEGEKDYFSVLETIIKFLHPMEKLSIMFTDEKTELEETRDAVRKIFHESQEEETFSSLKIYPIVELFYRLQRKTVINRNRLNNTNLAPFMSLPSASEKFNNPELSLLTRGCDYHFDRDVTEHCALSRVRCNGFILAKWCSDGDKYELKEGKHFPSTQVADNNDAINGTQTMN